MLKKITFISVILVFLFVPMFVSKVFADAPPDPGGGPGGGAGPVGGGAPIGGGLIVLLSMGAVYGMKKVYKLYKF